MARHLDNPDAWQTKLQVWSKIPFPFFWLGFGAVVGIAGCSVVWKYEASAEIVLLVGIDAVVIAAIANAVVYYEKLLDKIADGMEKLFHDDSGNLEGWMDRWYENIFSLRPNTLMALGMVVITTVPDMVVSHSPIVTWQGRATLIVINIIIGVLGGSMMWVMIGIARLVLSMGRDIKVRVSIFDTNASPLRVASGMLYRVSLTAVFVFTAGLSVNYFCSFKLNSIDIVMIAVFGVFLIAYFILPQLNIHRTLRDLKQRRMSDLVIKIDESFDIVTREPTPENITQLRELFDVQEIVNGRRSWSFGTNELLMLIGSVAIPLTIFAIRFFLQE